MKIRQIIFTTFSIAGIFVLCLNRALATEIGSAPVPDLSEAQTRLTGLNNRAVTKTFPIRTHKNGILFNPKTALYSAPDTVTEFRKNDLEVPDRSGRAELITATLGYSLLYYGWAVPLTFDAQSGRPYVASYMLLGGGSFFVPFLLTRENTITEGMARGFANGAGLGIAHGWALSIAAMGEEIDGRTGLGISVATSLSEGIFTLFYAKNRNLSRGHMDLLGSGGIWGGVLTAPMPYYFNSENPRAYAIAGLAGSGLGIWGANQLTKKIQIADGDPQIINTTATLGTFLAVSAAASFSNTFNEGTMATLMAGAAAGAGLGILKAKRLDYSTSEANLIFLGAFAGSMVGLGAIYVADGHADEKAYLWGSSLGALGGFVLTDRIVKKRPDGKLGNLQIQFNPIALGQLFKNTPEQPANMQNTFLQPQLVNARFRF